LSKCGKKQYAQKPGTGQEGETIGVLKVGTRGMYKTPEHAGKYKKLELP
jgi:hypothetical protein